MLCLRQVCLYTLRLYQARTLSSDLLLSQINSCTHEDEVFSLVERNKTRLSEKHVGIALNILWQLQKKRTLLLRTSDYIRNHSQFLTLCILAENKVEHMEDEAVVDTLYSILRLNVEGHDSLTDVLVTEAWKRLERLSLPVLSKFALCLYKQRRHRSPVIGKVAHIVDVKLDSIQDIRILSVLMISISDVISQSFQDRLLHKAGQLLEEKDVVHFSYAKRVLQFLQNVKLRYHHPLLEKCNQIFLKNASGLDIRSISLILGLYEQLGFDSAEFRLVAKQLLSETINDHYDPETFAKLFFTLGPMAGSKVRERLLVTAEHMAEEFSSHQVLVILKTMQKMKCRNTHLLKKMTSVLHKHLDSYHVLQLVKLTQYLVELRCHNLELFAKLKMLLYGFLKSSVIPADTAAIIRGLAMLPSFQVEEIIINKAAAVLPQCRLHHLNCIATALVKWNHYDQLHWQKSSERSVKLLQKLNDCGFQRLQKGNNLNLLLEELTHVNGEWFEEVLTEETMATCQRLIDQITWANVRQLSFFLIKTNHRCPSLLDRIACVTVENIDKIHPSEIYIILFLFSAMNYDPPTNEEFFESCIQYLTSNLSCFETYHLVLLGHVLAVAGYFPPVLIRRIFDVSFLSKLDAQLAVLPDTVKQRVRLCLMKLNRAVCLECPEFHIPWFHERYCQRVLSNSSGRIHPLRQHVHRMLTEILGGSHYARISVLTPYCYEIDFECVLDENKKPFSYVARNTPLDDVEGAYLRHDIEDEGRKALPPGAQRIALEFLDSKAFSKDSHHLKGEPAVKKRHLEMLGYRVVQIPHFEWYSMVLSTKGEQLEYLRKHLYGIQ
ncbi:FAST kinase domain-containing protein 1, mitochondrial isoform X1 [Falco naumanni]|uniref:FAST kinase domain-containing protein 1, mitochondrial isoform X1 n=1 Tax=Falco naumanni TaxID=148594 RepID=UPI001ADEAFBB|nr:FAST kinase domain-containing protein 1, mitochondrial isoform X1 [Falco naumanni]XP_040459578.1 FAST kinase domain-containing protein 1, mitochondrial isoform X1 [Falco naumanni]XP_040459579.1 FAST kinase domain-containing protein 1, mitochondrial isoform X1 [Falco naumanni]XP_040459580.1 FAST kinase domain-containing protein 1, mitochondrial isoform X1 [Falco naumanni]XP_040459581.1 FAST kinase domain-containing protein 1, mitochondrial isoform X1 [Falco naumanni]XP_040459582.1 FAST kinas